VLDIRKGSRALSHPTTQSGQQRTFDATVSLSAVCRPTSALTST
jgi:hypothetical protein